MLFPSVAAIMQEWLLALNAYAAPSYRDRQQCGFQMFLGACSLGKPTLPLSDQREDRCLFTVLMCPSSLGVFLEKTVPRLGTQYNFFIALVLVSFLFVWLSCLHVYFFFKGTLASHMIIDDVFHITIFPPGSAISLSLETQPPSLFSEVTSTHIHAPAHQPPSCCPNTCSCAAPSLTPASAEVSCSLGLLITLALTLLSQLCPSSTRIPFLCRSFKSWQPSQRR